MNQIVKASSPGEIMETVLIKGDLSKLTPDERNAYYFKLCESTGLNPLTQPIEYINLNGKLRLYAKKDCTDQLRAIHKVSVTDMTESEREGVYIVKSKVQNGEGRTDMAIGAVNIAGLKGEALANAMMKAETKSKRRATLSICGLGILDETEVEDVPDNQKRALVPVRVPSPSDIERDADAGPCVLTPFKNEKFPEWAERYIASVNGAKTEADLDKWDELNDSLLSTINERAPQVYKKIDGIMTAKRASFHPKPDPISSGPQVASQEKTKMVRNIEKDYGGHIQWLLLKIREHDDGGALESFWDKEIEPDRSQFFPADLTEIQDAYERKQLELNGDGS